jgi:hypothetical protein
MKTPFVILENSWWGSAFGDYRLAECYFGVSRSFFYWN